MPDPQYQLSNLILRSRGVVARTVDDVPPPGETFWLSQQNLEELQENALSTRLGTTVLSKIGDVAYPLGGTDAAVHSLSRLPGLSGSDWRYAGSADSLYRLTGDGPGAYSLIANNLSGQPWTAAQYNSPASSYPYIFIADQAVMLKDNGYLSAPQNNGIKQPQYPVTAQAQQPYLITLDNYTSASDYVYAGISPGSLIPVVSCSTSSAIPTTGIQEVDVTVIQQIGLFQLLTVDTAANQETVLVLEVTKTGFVADFTKTHLSGVAVGSEALDLIVPAATTGSVTLPFGGKPIAAWPTTLQQADYIGLYINVDDPNQIDSITLKFDCGDGTFESDFFWRTIGQGPLQQALNTSTDSSTAAADAILSESLGIYGTEPGGVSPLATGEGTWTALLMQLSDFSGTGRADFNSPNFNWNTVNAYQVEITTNGNGVGAAVDLAALILFGGYGPDSFAGVAYDYLYTFFNINDYTESNPCMVMTNVDPPLNTNWVLPRRQPVLLTLWNNFPTDTQSTHLRIYRRGGTLADAYRRIDQVPLTAVPGASQNYTDIWSDLQIQQSDTVSFTNDVPVTSSLPVPVNTTLTSPITATGQFSSPAIVASLANISVGQQVSIGNVAAANFETVIVTGIVPNLSQFGAWFQNTHAVGEAVTATAAYAVPLDIIAVANDIGYYAGDKNNPSYLYISAKGNIQYVSSASYLPVSVPSDPITAIVASSGNIFVSTILRWWALAPAAQVGGSGTIYPTRVDHGCVGKNAWVLRDGIAYFMGQDGLRTFVAGGGDYISEIIEFVWQNTGPTPIPIADPAYFSNIRASTWNRWVFFSYRAMDGKTYRIVLDVPGKRYRNDSIDAQSMYLEADTNSLVWGDSKGMVHLDRQLVAYDEQNVGGVIVQSPIPITLQTPYNDGATPAFQKNYNELVIDADTGGNTVTATLDFNDGEFTEVIGTVNTTERERINLSLNSGDGFEAYKVGLTLTGQGTTRIYLYQCALRSVVLAQTRKSFDSWWLKLGTAESKVVKQIYLDLQATATVNVSFYYDSNTTPGYTFSIAPNDGVRNSLRIRLPAILCRLFRIVMESSGDFQLWPDSRIEYKGVAQGKGYSVELIAQ